jgi:hypothetical protein
MDAAMFACISDTTAISCRGRQARGDEAISYIAIENHPGTKFISVMTELLFSYGTLQLEKVQLESFGRLLKGEKDALSGYKLVSLEIKDEKVLEQSQQPFHPMAIPSVDKKDKVQGVVFEITGDELLKADSYEVSDYVRISVILDSGKNAWIYVSGEFV